MEYVEKHLDEYLKNNYLQFTEVAMSFFKIAPNLDNVKFHDKYGCFKVYRKEIETPRW